ncbi:hypothetical protein EHM76_01145 [bacterium]|nr:MAG: hypothetical protein EHM76_01145 [bacterium]
MLVLNVFLWSDLIEFSCKQPLDLSARLIFGIDVLFLVLLVMLGVKLINKGYSFHKYFIFINLAVLVIQIIYAYNIYFFTGWDVSHVFDAVHYVINKSSFVRINAMYPFSVYPNNLGILFLLLPIEWFARLIHVDGYLASIMVSVLAVNLAGVFLYYLINHMTQKPMIALFTWFLFNILIGFSPWITIPYTDTFTILFPISALYIYVTKKNQIVSIRRSLLIGFLLFWGMYIKPSVSVVLVAIVLTEFLSLGKFSEKKLMYRKLISIGLIILGGTPIFLGNALVHGALSEILQPEARFTALHYINMGLNTDRDGVFWGEDVDYSKSFQTVKERNRGNLSKILSRLSSFGVEGYAQFLSRKALANFADGTFAWGIEGNFFRIIPERTNPISKILNSYIIGNGVNYSKFLTNGQFAWYLSLLILPFLVFVPKQINTDMVLLCLSILGIIAFVMLFEARARYLINHIPVFLVGVGMGYNNLISITMKIIDMRKKPGASG